MEPKVRVEQYISEMKTAVQHPRIAVREWKQRTGAELIGCFPYYCPEELVHAAGLLPVGCWGGQTQIAKAGNYFPPFACSLIQSAMEYALNGVYDELSGVIIPAPCDTLKQFSQNWQAAIPAIPAITVVYPLQKTAYGVDYLVQEFDQVCLWLERITGRPITNEKINESIKIYNTNRKLLRQFTRVAAEHPDLITPLLRHAVIKSRTFMDKARHSEVVASLIEFLDTQDKSVWPGKKVILTGIMAEPDGFLQMLQDSTIAVVADDLAQESRLFRVDVPEGEEPLERLAQQWLRMDECSLIFTREKTRANLLIELARQHAADGIVYCMMKFCEPEEFDFPIILKEAEAAGVSVICLEIDQQTNSLEQLRTRLQAFVEISSLGNDKK